MALIDTQKEKVLNKIAELQARFLQVREDCKEVLQVWNSNTMGAGGANEFVDADLTGTQFEGRTAADVIAAMGTIEAFETFYDAGQDDNMTKFALSA